MYQVDITIVNPYESNVRAPGLYINKTLNRPKGRILKIIETHENRKHSFV